VLELPACAAVERIKTVGRFVEATVAGLQKTKNLAGKCPPPDSDSVWALPSLAKSRLLVKAARSNCEPLISVRGKQLAFHPLAQRNAFRRRGARPQRRSFARWNQSLRRSPNSNRLCLRLSAMISQYFTRSGFRPGCFTDC
jgi:hypothetical protein